MTYQKVLLAIALVVTAVVPVSAQETGKKAFAARWVATQLNGKPVSGPTLDYTIDQASGTGGCNRFNGPFATENTAVQIGPLVATKMMCEGRMEMESAYFAALEATRSFVIKDDTLTLKAEDGRDLVKFRK